MRIYEGLHPIIIGALTAALFGTPAFAQGPSSAPATNEYAARLNQIETQIEALRRQLAELKQELTRATGPDPAPRAATVAPTATTANAKPGSDLKTVRSVAQAGSESKATPEPKAEQPPAPTAVIRAGKEGFALRSSDDSFVMRFRGYVHSDARFYAEDHVLAADTFLLRRVRPVLDGTLYRQFDFKVMPDFGEGGKNIIQDAYLEARFTPALKLRVGKYKEPIGLERLASATDIAFVERALPTALVPNRDIGLMLNGDLHKGTVSYALGVFNGVVDGGSADSDDQDGKDVAARLFLQPFKGKSAHAFEGLGFGISTSYGVQRGTFLVPNLPNYKSGGQLTFFRYRADLSEAGSAVANGDHVRVSPQAYYYHGPVGVLFEQVISTQQIKRSTTNAAKLTNTAWQLMGSWVLTGEKAGYRAPVPTRNFDSKAHAWGAWELAARVNALNVDTDAFPIFANPSVAAQRALAWGIGLNWYLNPGIKIINDYEQTTFTGGSPSGNRPTEHAYLSRFQISF